MDEIATFWTIWLLVLAVTIGLRLAMINRLRTRHNATWEALGRPTLWNGDAKRQLLEIKFLLAGRHRSLDDSALSGLAAVYAALYVLIVGGFVILVIGSLIGG